MAQSYSMCSTCGNVITAASGDCEHCSKPGAQAVSLEELKAGMQKVVQPDSAPSQTKDAPPDLPNTAAQESQAKAEATAMTPENSPNGKSRIRPTAERSPLQSILAWFRGLFGS